jgi:hypothetical protein
MTRISNWAKHLNALVDSRRNTPFQWGVNDCMLWPADCVLAITGEDPAAEYRGTYSTALSAMRIAEKHGGIRGLVSRQLNDWPVKKEFARRGDIVTFRDDDRFFGGVHLGNVAAFVSTDGLAFIPANKINELIWRIG